MHMINSFTFKEYLNNNLLLFTETPFNYLYTDIRTDSEYILLFF